LYLKLGCFFEARLNAALKGEGIDWGNGELLAYSSLLGEGHSVRLTGQDVERGTFTHRHAVVTDFETNERLNCLAPTAQKGARAMIFNSSLSEAAVMAFEFGVSISDPQTLTIWEGQFGDFVNGAQAVIDQFLAASESKWQRSSGLVLFLPHGMEGQGPEHSSARLERFLQLSANGNMNVCNLTTPAQIFHALRRQMKRSFRKPLIIMSPKSLLRHPLAVSRLDEFTERGFQEIIAEQKPLAQRVLLCSGKIYYDLFEALEAATPEKRAEIALVRVEQLYPLHTEKLLATLNSYSRLKEVFWVQEETMNMGAWSYILMQWQGGSNPELDARVSQWHIKYIGRKIGASPACGSPKRHSQEQKEIIEKALNS